MPIHVKFPVAIQASGNKPKVIEEFVGRASSGTEQVSIARMQSPPGWIEPAQRPEFDEYTLVLKGILRVDTDRGSLEVRTGEAVIVHRDEWVRYSTPGSEGAEYIAVCLPAFTSRTVHRETGPEGA